MALTAALWDLNLNIGSLEFDWPLSQTINLLSFPPLAKYLSSNDHFNPQISYLWPSILWIKLFLSLKSRFNILLSLEPVLRIWLLDHESAPTLPSWPSNFLKSFYVSVSQTWTTPVCVPAAIYCPPSLDQPTEATKSSSSA